MKLSVAARAVLPMLIPWPDIAPTVAAEKAVDEALEYTSQVRLRVAERVETMRRNRR